MTTSRELQCVLDIQQWIETEAEFKGRSDKQFVLIFLRACNFDVEKASDAVSTYYECKRKYPQFWTKRSFDDRDLRSVLNLKVTTMLMDSSANQPAVSISVLARFGPMVASFNSYVKLQTIYTDVLLRRQSCQMNGFVWIIDAANYPVWLAGRLMWPPTAKTGLDCFYHCMPLNVRAVIVVNAPSYGATLFKMIQLFLPQTVKQKIFFVDSYEAELPNFVSRDWLPEEYGGSAGPMSRHEDAFEKELVLLNEYMADDDNYGFIP